MFKKLLFWRRRTVVVDVEKFGPRLSWVELESVMRHQAETPLFKAVCQLALFQRQRCQKAVEDKSNLVAGQTAYEAGAAAGIADLLAILLDAERGVFDADVKGWFPEPQKK